MIKDIAIRAENIGKRYRIGAQEAVNKNFREIIVNGFKAPFRRAERLLRGQASKKVKAEEIVWALKDVSFEIKRGETVGIIGGNGAGKSTLLKVISRITEPTQGFAEIYGRMGSLLEVGTGFHAELTGRENIFLNGAILGMKKSEIRAKFDEIVAFSGVEKFLDTPVKHYSTGMYLRLAFAVAAHLETEILIVDEVLAVGDMQFQKKCLNKMHEVGKEGRTVLFVSHSMQAITRLCKRVILLKGGVVICDGPSHQGVTKYLESGLSKKAEQVWNDIQKAPGNDIVRMVSVRIKKEDGVVSETIDIRQPFFIEMEYEVLQPGQLLLSSYGFSNENNVCIFVITDRDPCWQRKPRPAGRFVSTAVIPGNLLSEGTIIVGAGVVTENPYTLHCDVPDAVAFQVVDSMDGDSARGDFGGRHAGIVRPLLKWTNRYIPKKDPVMEDNLSGERGIGNGEYIRLKENKKSQNKIFRNI